MLWLTAKVRAHKGCLFFCIFPDLHIDEDFAGISDSQENAPEMEDEYSDEEQLATVTVVEDFDPHALLQTSDVEIPIGFTVAMSCVMCNRLLLNLRGSKHGRLRRNASASAQAYGSRAKSQAHLTSAEDCVDVETEGPVEVGLGEYELHKLRTLKPTRSRSANVV